MFFDDVKTLYDLGTPESHRISGRSDLQRLPAGCDKATLDSLAYLPLQDLEVVDLDTGEPADRRRRRPAKSTVALELPIANDKQSAHLRLTGTIVDPSYTLANGQLVFTRTLKGLRNTVLLPAGWDGGFGLAVRHDWRSRGARVRGVDQPQCRERIRRADQGDAAADPVDSSTRTRCAAPEFTSAVRPRVGREDVSTHMAVGDADEDVGPEQHGVSVAAARASCSSMRRPCSRADANASSPLALRTPAM